MIASKRLIGVLILGSWLLTAALTACNTVEGAGKDIKSTGRAIEKEADEHH
jgi:predicted small secreted protein